MYEKCNADGIYKIKETYSSLPNGNEIEIKTDVNELQCGRSCNDRDQCKVVSYRNDECLLLRHLQEPQNDSSFSLDPTTVWRTYQTIGCDEGWELFQFHCYFYIAEQFNWPSCITACHDVGTHVVTITSERENNFICDLRKNNGYNGNVIVGGTDQNEEGSWEWITGEPKEGYLPYESFYSKQLILTCKATLNFKKTSDRRHINYVNYMFLKRVNIRARFLNL